LKEAGYIYLMDWPADDQPFWLATRSGPILSVPYPAELNDSAAIIHRDGTARDFADMIVDGFDEMIEQCLAPAAVQSASHPTRTPSGATSPPHRPASSSFAPVDHSTTGFP
jgi:allantoinase